MKDVARTTRTHVLKALAFLYSFSTFTLLIHTSVVVDGARKNRLEGAAFCQSKEEAGAYLKKYLYAPYEDSPWPCIQTETGITFYTHKGISSPVVYTRRISDVGAIFAHSPKIYVLEVLGQYYIVGTTRPTTTNL